MTLQHRNDNTPAIPEQDGEGIRPHDLRPPFLVLIQKGEGEGQWRRTDTNEVLDDPQVIPLRLWQTRRKWPKGDFQSDRRPECWSANGRVAAPGSAKEGQACGECEFRRDDIFAMTDDEDSKGGACAPTYAAIVLDAYSFEPLLLNLGSKTMYRLASALDTNMRIARVELSAKWFEGKKGKWFSPSAKRIERLNDEDKEQLQAMYARFAGVSVDMTTPEEQPAPEPEPAPEQPREPVAATAAPAANGQSYANASELPF